MNFNVLPKLEQKAYNWLKIYLYGLPWENDDYLYLNLKQILWSFVLRNHCGVSYAKGKEKTDFLAKYLDQKIENLDGLSCPRVKNIYISKNNQVGIDIYLITNPGIIVLWRKKKFFMIGWKMNNSEDQRKWRHTYQNHCFLRRWFQKLILKFP